MAAKFDDVWTWTEWPERGTRTDTGIDLVAKVREPDTFAAIQCKFYDENSTVAKGDIDSFLSASSKAEFSARYIFDTAKGWSKNADETLEGQLVPVQRVDISYLENAGIDWSGYSWTTRLGRLPRPLHRGDAERLQAGPRGPRGEHRQIRMFREARRP